MARRSSVSNWIMLIIILAGLVVLNPSHEKHKTKINQTLKGDHPLIGAIGGGKLLGALTKYQNYYLFSVTDVKGEQISVGVLGFVIVNKLEDL